MIKKRNLKIFLVLMLVGIFSSAGTVMAASEILEEPKRTSLPAGGEVETIATGSRTPARDCVRFTLKTSTKKVSKSYPLYFKLKNAENNNSASKLVTIKTAPCTRDLYYTIVINKWKLRGQTDSNSKAGTEITFDAIP